MQVDFVNCQFAFHYSFESLPQAECMLRNASESLRAGGYFIGSIPDAYDLVYVALLLFLSICISISIYFISLFHILVSKILYEKQKIIYINHVLA